MNKSFITVCLFGLVLLFITSVNAQRNGAINRSKPKPHLLSTLSFPFWGHIQQYKIGKDISITYPDRHTELYDEYGNLEKKIQCVNESEVRYDKKSKSLTCGMKLTRLAFKIGFKKSDLEKTPDRIITFGNTLIEFHKIKHGFNVKFTWNEYRSVEKKYIYQDKTKQYVFLMSYQYLNPEKRPQNPMYGSKEEILDYIHKHPSWIPDVRIWEENRMIMEDGPCETWARDILGDHDKDLRCTYLYLNKKMFIDKCVAQGLNQIGMIFNYNLPHDKMDYDYETYCKDLSPFEQMLLEKQLQ